MNRVERAACAALLGLALAALASVTQAKETVLHTERSLYRTIVVTEDEAQRCMLFSRRLTTRQSCYMPAEPQRILFDYLRMMMGALYVNPQPRRILVIGLGGGTLVDALQHVLPDARIDAVELDPAVIRVAQTYFAFKPGPNVKLHDEDGRVFVKRVLRWREKYDLVMLDAYDHEYIPEHLLTQEFLREVQGILAPGGVVAANTFSSSKLYDHESTTYASVFGRFFNLKRNNRVIIARPDGLPEAETIRANAARLQKAFEPMDIDSAWLAGLFDTTPDWRADARVLTDRYSPSNLLNSTGTP